MLWLLLRIRSGALQGPSMGIASSLFYGWGLLLEDRPYEPPTNLTGQVLVGIWLITCLMLRAFYMSSLISRLVEGGKPPVINAIEEMVARGETDGWKLGSVTMTGVFNTFFSTSSNPDFLIAKQFMQTMGPEEGMRKVLEGDFSYIHNYYVMRILLATHQQGTDSIPVHISTTKYPLFPGNTWAFRPSSSFITKFNEGIQRLLNAGLIDFWMEDVILTNVTKRRIQEKESDENINFSNTQVVLGLLHLQVTFYLLLTGHTAAASVFLVEHALAR
ncbi:hypothetical protein O3P69_002616 [Scylla paramamosain]|uniref:Ionotropic glutamate receptor C-terminal domain-containing protein n=1 Tax=Scylla paramamosain TaxID=85552 RepID=A0AAW0UM54_SCYPA